MDYKFELFEEGESVRSRGGAYVTISKDCKIYFNDTAIEAIGRPDGVALMFDRSRRVIGVKPAPLNREHSYRLRKKDANTGGRVITARNFLTHYGIKCKQTIAFTSVEANRDGILILDLNQAAPIRRPTKQAQR